MTETVFVIVCYFINLITGHTSGRIINIKLIEQFKKCKNKYDFGIFMQTKRGTKWVFMSTVHYPSPSVMVTFKPDNDSINTFFYYYYYYSPHNNLRNKVWPKRYFIHF